MLGGFEMYYGGALVQLKKKNTSKPVQLLQMLLFNREAGIARHSLIEALYDSEGEIDAANTILRALIRFGWIPRKLRYSDRKPI